MSFVRFQFRSTVFAEMVRDQLARSDVGCIPPTGLGLVVERIDFPFDFGPTPMSGAPGLVLEQFEIQRAAEAGPRAIRPHLRDHVLDSGYDTVVIPVAGGSPFTYQRQRLLLTLPVTLHVRSLEQLIEGTGEPVVFTIDVQLNVDLVHHDGKDFLRVGYAGLGHHEGTDPAIEAAVAAELGSGTIPSREVEFDYGRLILETLTELGAGGDAPQVCWSGMSLSPDRHTVEFRLELTFEDDASGTYRLDDWLRFYRRDIDNLRGELDWAVAIGTEILLTSVGAGAREQLEESDDFDLDSDIHVEWRPERPGFHTTFSGEAIDACWCLFVQLDVNVDVTVETHLSLAAAGPSPTIQLDTFVHPERTSTAEGVCCFITGGALWPILGLVYLSRGQTSFGKFLLGFFFWPIGGGFLAMWRLVGGRPRELEPECHQDPGNEEHQICTYSFDLNEPPEAFLYQIWQTAPNNGWSGWSPMGGSWHRDPVVSSNEDGRLELFVVGDDRQLYQIWQTAPDNGWSGFASMGGSWPGRPAVGQNADGRLEVFARGDDGVLYQNWQTAPNNGWSGWSPMGGSWHRDPVVSSNEDGRLELFIVGDDGALYQIWQTAPDNGWSGFASMGGSWPGDPAVGQNEDGRLEVFARGDDGVLYQNWQTAPNNGWSGWSPMGGSWHRDPVVSSNEDGRLELFVVGDDRQLYQIWQTAPNNGWSGFAAMGGSWPGAPAVGQNEDGRLEVFARGEDEVLYQNWQTAPNNGWSGWASMGGSSPGDPTVGQNADGRLEVFARGTGPCDPIASAITLDSITGRGDALVLAGAVQQRRLAAPAVEVSEPTPFVWHGPRPTCEGTEGDWSALSAFTVSQVGGEYPLQVCDVIPVGPIQAIYKPRITRRTRCPTTAEVEVSTLAWTPGNPKPDWILVLTNVGAKLVQIPVLPPLSDEQKRAHEAFMVEWRRQHCKRPSGWWEEGEVLETRWLLEQPYGDLETRRVWVIRAGGLASGELLVVWGGDEHRRALATALADARKGLRLDLDHQGDVIGTERRGGESDREGACERYGLSITQVLLEQVAVRELDTPAIGLRRAGSSRRPQVEILFADPARRLWVDPGSFLEVGAGPGRSSPGRLAPTAGRVVGLAVEHHGTRVGLDELQALALKTARRSGLAPDAHAIVRASRAADRRWVLDAGAAGFLEVDERRGQATAAYRGRPWSDGLVRVPGGYVRLEDEGMTVRHYRVREWLTL